MQHAQKLVKFGRVVVELCQRTDRHRDRQIDSSQYSHLSRGRSNMDNFHVIFGIFRFPFPSYDQVRTARIARAQSIIGSYRKIPAHSVHFTVITSIWRIFLPGHLTQMYLRCAMVQSQNVSVQTDAVKAVPFHSEVSKSIVSGHYNDARRMPLSLNGLNWWEHGDARRWEE